jgi:hypothetical protein
VIAQTILVTPTSLKRSAERLMNRDPALAAPDEKIFREQ